MFFDFAARSPEINSALMYAGAGAGPMVAAASAFSSLASELSTTATGYQSVISQLTGSAWQGPSATAMAAAAEPYITWLNTTSGQLQKAASQAIASAAAYETAFAATVPPPLIAANRAQLATLVATNVLGQNTPAIAANEAQYAEMWAQDAAALYAYAAKSAALAQMQPVTPPADNTNPAGAGLQAAAVSNAVNSNATASGLNGVLSSLTNAQGALANPVNAAAAAAPASSGTSVWQGLNDLLNTGIVTNSINTADVTASWNVMMLLSAMPLLGHFLSNAPAGVTIGDVTPLGAGLGGGVLAGATAPAAGGVGAAPVAASMGEASLVGKMSVPASWSAATPETSVATEFEGSGWTVAPEETTPVATVPAGMPSVASAGRGGYGFGTPRYGVKPTVMPKTVLV
ncbi:PPE family protein [Mycobacterium noviomagense]|uniref:PPE family protein n=1 Tax=Mycobacterium noviomagense TaxID=459858 RepID=A0A7I7PH25_9MYCO|nr:PPE family protein [Mycobacterium noviomagense]ORB13863.1 PPE family protein [Mycobacterium noviomagense]BBY07862.1 PPE family protein PPE15 [Mycobacterium noviomagense]